MKVSFFFRIHPWLLPVSISYSIFHALGDICNGKGKVTLTRGHIYTGSFKNGRMHGKGELEWPDGTKYIGQFVDNKIFGRGTYTWFVHFRLSVYLLCVCVCPTSGKTEASIPVKL